MSDNVGFIRATCITVAAVTGSAGVVSSEGWRQLLIGLAIIFGLNGIRPND